MLQKIIIVCALLLCVAGAKAQTALEYNNRMALITDSLYAKGTRWGAEFKMLMPLKKFAELAPLRKDIEQFIDQKTSELKKDKDIHGSLEMKAAMLEFLAFEKDYVSGSFGSIDKLPETATDEEVQSKLAKLIDDAKKEEAVLAKVNTAQDAYAKKNGFEIEKK